MRPQWIPKSDGPVLRRWTGQDHRRVMFPDCPRCGGRVIWGGDGDTRWTRITGVRGACLLCPFEAYTRDLLVAEDQRLARDILRGAA